MKARTPIVMTKEQLQRDYVPKKLIKEEVEKEFQEKYDELQNEIQENIVVQLMGTVMYTLDVSHNWKGKRLKSFLDEVNDMFSIMDTGCFGKTFNAVDNVNYIKEKYGIDLKKEITIEN